MAGSAPGQAGYGIVSFVVDAAGRVMRKVDQAGDAWSYSLEMPEVSQGSMAILWLGRFDWCEQRTRQDAASTGLGCGAIRFQGLTPPGYSYSAALLPVARCVVSRAVEVFTTAVPRHMAGG